MHFTVDILLGQPEEASIMSVVRFHEEITEKNHNLSSIIHGDRSRATTRTDALLRVKCPINVRQEGCEHALSSVVPAALMHTHATISDIIEVRDKNHTWSEYILECIVIISESGNLPYQGFDDIFKPV